MHVMFHVLYNKSYRDLPSVGCLVRTVLKDVGAVHS
jgi:hypothetical protein